MKLPNHIRKAPTDPRVIFEEDNFEAMSIKTKVAKKKPTAAKIYAIMITPVLGRFGFSIMDRIFLEDSVSSTRSLGIYFPLTFLIGTRSSKLNVL